MSFYYQYFFRCDDFYEYACGNYLKSLTIPIDRGEVSPFSIVQDQLDYQLFSILNETAQSDEISLFKNARNFYKSCIDTETIEQLGATPILDKLDSMGGWPVLMADGSWNEADWTLEQSILNAKENGFTFDFFFSFDIINSQVYKNWVRKREIL
jgi:predicted metalloendopeptidase